MFAIRTGRAFVCIVKEVELAGFDTWEMLLLQTSFTSIFVNTSRGEVVNSVDLLHALNTNEISSVGLDVLNGERYEEGRKSLVDYSKQSNRLIITPHLGGSTVEARLKRSNHICKLLSDWNTNEN